MSEESAFLNQILADPSDRAARLVYADWLDERGDPQSAAKAAFLRSECELFALPPNDPREVKLRRHVAELARPLNTDWLAMVSELPIENCSVRFAFECPKRWESLRTIDDPGVRFCDACEKHVHFCDTIHEARRHAALGDCIAIDLAIPRRDGDLTRPAQPRPPYARRMGRIRVDAVWRRWFRPDPVSVERERRKREQSRGGAS